MHHIKLVTLSHENRPNLLSLNASHSKVKFGSEQFVATSENVFFPLQWVGGDMIIICNGWVVVSSTPSILISFFFQTRVCVSLQPKTSTVKLVVDGETIVEEVRIANQDD